MPALTAVTYAKAHTDVAHDLEFIPGLLYRAAGDEASRWLMEEGLEDAIATRFDEKTGRPVSADDAMLEDKCLPPWLAKINNMILLEEDQKKKDEKRPEKGGGQPTPKVPKGSAVPEDEATFNLGDQTILSETVRSDDSLPEDMDVEAAQDSEKPLSNYAPTFNLPKRIMSVTSRWARRTSKVHNRARRSLRQFLNRSIIFLWRNVRPWLNYS